MPRNISFDKAALYSLEKDKSQAKQPAQANATYIDAKGVITMPFFELLAAPSLYAAFFAAKSHTHMILQVDCEDFATLTPLNEAGDHSVLELSLTKRRTFTDPPLTEKRKNLLSKRIFAEASLHHVHAVALRGKVFGLMVLKDPPQPLPASNLY